MSYCSINGIFEEELAQAINQIARSIPWHSSVVKLAGSGQSAFFPDHHWLSGFAFHFASLANSENWQFDIAGTSAVQFCKFGVGEQHDWHMDALGFTHSSQLSRKLTIVIDYQADADKSSGGDLELLLTAQDEDKKIVKLDGAKKTGSIYIFPSYVPFRTTELKSGSREYALCWALGNKFE